MKIYTDGGRGDNCQINRIDKGFIELGNELTQDIRSADVIYSNNPSDSWDKIIHYKKSGELKGRVIFNVLDIPEHLSGYYDLNELYERLKCADCITSISEFVRTQLIRYFNLDSRVIYNPIKEVYKRKPSGKFDKYKFLCVGRVNDKNKRINLAFEALDLLNISFESVAIAGSENPGVGNYLGVVSDEDLNDLYNSVDFVLMPSLLEGIGLPALEGMVCGAIPIICYDLTTFYEFYYRDWGIYPSSTAIAYRINSLINNKSYFEYERVRALELGESISEQFNYVTVAKRILEIEKNVDIFQNSAILTFNRIENGCSII